MTQLLGTSRCACRQRIANAMCAWLPCVTGSKMLMLWFEAYGLRFCRAKSSNFATCPGEYLCAHAAPHWPADAPLHSSGGHRVRARCMRHSARRGAFVYSRRVRDEHVMQRHSSVGDHFVKVLARIYHRCEAEITQVQLLEQTTVGGRPKCAAVWSRWGVHRLCRAV